MVSWERYERERDALADKLANADTELSDTKKVFSMELGPKDHADRVKTAASMRKDIEGSFTAMVSANDTLNQLLEDDMKMELGEQVGLNFVIEEKLYSPPSLESNVSKKSFSDLIVPFPRPVLQLLGGPLPVNTGFLSSKLEGVVASLSWPPGPDPRPSP